MMIKAMVAPRPTTTPGATTRPRRTTGFALGLLCLAWALSSLLAQPGQAAELIMLEENGCYWCETWNKDIGGIYDKTNEGKRAPLRRLNIHERLPSDVAFITKGSFTPTFVLVHDGREIGRIRGYPGPDFFWPLLGELLKKVPAAEADADAPAPKS